VDEEPEELDDDPDEAELDEESPLGLLSVLALPLLAAGALLDEEPRLSVR
jgi:hypothetical protein